jgi:hypothetical protein
VSPADDDAPELFVVVADADVEKLIDRVLKRGVQRKCLRSLRWVIRREPMRDPGVRQSPLRAVPDLKPGCGKLLVILDHRGCGKDVETPDTVEAELREKVLRAGFGVDDAKCVVLEPELEEVLVPVWDRVAELMAVKRRAKAPSPSQIMARLGLSADDETPVHEAWRAWLAQQPKECFLGLLRSLNLRHQPALYDEIAREVSLPALKEGRAGRRLGDVLVEWFGAPRALSGGDQ